MNAWFGYIAEQASRHLGRSHSFIIALLIVVVWACMGPLFRYSDTWQLIINTGTTIATFLMVFLLQHTQNRDSMAVQLKLDELIASSARAHNAMLALERFSEPELEAKRRQFMAMAEEGRSE